MKKTAIFVTVFSLLLLISALAQAARYEVVQVDNGGTIKGKVKTGLTAKDPVIPIHVKEKGSREETEQEKKACITTPPGQQALMYLLSASNEVRNVLVIVENVAKGKAAPKTDYTIDNLSCRFEPLVGIAYVGSHYIIKNSDPVLHNTNLAISLGGDRRRAVYNLALPHKNQTIKKTNRVPGLIDIKCDAHVWMRAYVYSSRHPYVAITDDGGNFEIKDLLPGKYSVRFWHEGFEEVVREVEVTAGKASELNAVFEKTVTPGFLGGH